MHCPARALRCLHARLPAPSGVGRSRRMAAAAAPPASDSPPPLLQYVVLRKDLRELGWPLGSVVAQACHACVAALWLSREEGSTQAYCSPEALDSMHKVVLEVKGETQLRALAEALQAAGVAHKLWVEQPEGVATCLATAPGAKEALAVHFKRLALAK